MAIASINQRRGLVADWQAAVKPGAAPFRLYKGFSVGKKLQFGKLLERDARLRRLRLGKKLPQHTLIRSGKSMD
ncbi:MAG: hypothetical protein AAGE61_13055 [Pseudomonadota bacterium]